ncbi:MULTISPECIES: hypothetical protein [unclassified Nostoc]|nr:hypothetical protein [Nostoc sp. DedQUE03]MDZ7975076.1 hypothetical protein [Nostoc sp. DedQUE03]MDZ8043988.1 hypothetical protein [Nostoc sp. DedQUE02]
MLPIERCSRRIVQHTVSSTDSTQFPLRSLKELWSSLVNQHRIK